MAWFVSWQLNKCCEDRQLIKNKTNTYSTLLHMTPAQIAPATQSTYNSSRPQPTAPQQSTTTTAVKSGTSVQCATAEQLISAKQPGAANIKIIPELKIPTTDIVAQSINYNLPPSSCTSRFIRQTEGRSAQNKQSDLCQWPSEWERKTNNSDWTKTLLPPAIVSYLMR